MISLALYQRDFLGDAVSTIPFEWYVQGRERIVNLRLQNLDGGAALKDVRIHTAKFDDTFEGGQELVESQYFSAKLAASGTWTPLGEFTFGDIAEDGYVDFDLKLNIPVTISSTGPILCAINPTETQVERATARLVFTGYDETNITSGYETFYYETQGYEDTAAAGFVENVFNNIFLEVTVFSRALGALMETNGVYLPS